MIDMKKETRILMLSDVHYCENGWYGVTREKKRERLCTDLEAEYAQAPYDALLLLGDYSLDHWGWAPFGSYLTRGVSDTHAFCGDCLGRIAPKGVEVRMIAGNHEQYGEALWEELTGFRRRDYLVLGDILLILTDTFGGDLDPDRHSDGTYIGANVGDIVALMASHPTKRVILCSHWFDMKKESPEFCALLAKEERILCLACGHNHISKIGSTGEDCGSKPILYTGHYSYSGEKNPLACLPGYRELIITDTAVTSKYIVPSHSYTMQGITFVTEYGEQDAITIPF